MNKPYKSASQMLWHSNEEAFTFPVASNPVVHLGDRTPILSWLVYLTTTSASRLQSLGSSAVGWRALVIGNAWADSSVRLQTV